MNRQLLSRKRIVLFVAALSFFAAGGGIGRSVAEEAAIAPHPDPTMEALIQAIEKEEAKFERLEATIRLEKQYQNNKWRIPTSVETIRTISQPERFFAERTRVDTDMNGRKYTYKSASGYDGETTTAIEYENSANRMNYRYEPSYAIPPHAWGLFHFEVNFPLSVYLRGGEALAHPKVRKLPREIGTIFEVYKVESEYAGEERVNDLDCVKLRVKRWYYTTDQPAPQLLWLAKDRNYHCVKTQTISRSKTDPAIETESITYKFRQIASGVWLPELVTVRNFDNRALKEGKQTVSLTRKLSLETSTAAPAHTDDQFRISVPGTLPVYSLTRYGMVDSPHHPQPMEKKSSTTVAEIIENIRRAERMYERLDLTIADYYQAGEEKNDALYSEGASMTMVSLSKMQSRMRSVHFGDRFFFEKSSNYPGQNNSTRVSREIQAFDGTATRSTYATDRQKPGEVTVQGGTLTPDGADLPRVCYPHMMTVLEIMGKTKLSSLLEDEWEDKEQGIKQNVSYVGDSTIDGLLCHCVRRDMSTERIKLSSHLLWICPARNYIAVRTEWLSPQHHAVLPTGIHTVESWKDLAAGICIPELTRCFSFYWFHTSGLMEGRIIHQWQRDYKVESAILNPKVDDSLFSNITAPKGTKVSVRLANGERLGQFELEETGPLTISEDKLNELKATAKLSREAEAARVAALDAMLGQPAPAFPSAHWLNGDPLTWEKLKGKVVILDFWARWCGPCVPDTKRLSDMHKANAEQGGGDRVIIGVHTTSHRDDVAATVKERGIGYPICIDAQPRSGEGWGELFNNFSVNRIPFAFVIDKQGNVAGYGTLDQVLAKSAELLRPKEETDK